MFNYSSNSDLVKIPRKVIEKILDELECYKSVLISERDINALDILNLEIKELKACINQSSEYV